MTRATVNYLGVALTVEYDYVPGESQTYIDPGYPACAEVSSVQIGGVEVLDMLSNDQREAIETLLIEAREEADGDALYEKCRDEMPEEA